MLLPLALTRTSWLAAETTEKSKLQVIRMTANGENDGKVKLWDFKSKTQISELSGHDKPVMSVSFSPNQKLLASGSKNKTVRIWQLS